MVLDDVNPPESQRVVAAEVVRDAEGERDVLLVRADDGRRHAFVFEVESDSPGLSRVDPARWRAAAAAPEDSAERFDAVVEARADDWLPSLVAHPIAAEWLRRIEEEHPSAYHLWFAQTQYESGGEEGSG